MPESRVCERGNDESPCWGTPSCLEAEPAFMADCVELSSRSAKGFAAPNCECENAFDILELACIQVDVEIHLHLCRFRDQYSTLDDLFQLVNVKSRRLPRMISDSCS